MTTISHALTVDQALEDAFGVNPLLGALPRRFSVDDLPDLLSNKPLDQIKWRSVRLSERTDFLPLMSSHFVPTPEASKIAMSIQQLIRTGYIERHPGVAVNRLHMHAVAALKGKTVREVPWFARNAKGMVLEGITGLGKSTIVDRVLELFPQTCVHEANAAAGWLALKQLVYLKVSMSADKSRAGFLGNILIAVDTALGTDYHNEYGIHSGVTVEKLMVIIGIILTTHFCGLLVIDEIQLRNFEPSASRHTMLLFFLRLLNFGIPILLIGNPLGFKGFESFSQDTRRLYKGDSVELWPSDTSNGIAWKIFIAGKVKFCVLQNGLDLTDTVMDEIFRCTGGVHDYFDTLWYVMQVRAIKAKKEGLEFSDIGAAYRSMSMKRLRPMIDALVSKDALALMKFQDIPAEDFAKRWGVKLTPASLPALANKEAVKNQLDAGAATDAGGLQKPSFEKNEEKFSAHQKRVERKHKVAKDLTSTLSEKDLRTSANIEALLEGANQLRCMTGRK